MQTEDGQGKSLPVVRLISPDTIADVAAFYKQRMTDWQNDNHEGGVILWQGDKSPP